MASLSYVSDAFESYSLTTIVFVAVCFDLTLHCILTSNSDSRSSAHRLLLTEFLE